jgi:aminomethyltransferase
VVKLGKGSFVGSDALRAQHESGVQRRLVGIEMDDPGSAPARSDDPSGRRRGGHGHQRDEVADARDVHRLAYIACEQSTVGTRLRVDVRGRRHAAHVVPKPFYRRSR